MKSAYRMVAHSMGNRRKLSASEFLGIAIRFICFIVQPEGFACGEGFRANRFVYTNSQFPLRRAPTDTADDSPTLVRRGVCRTASCVALGC